MAPEEWDRRRGRAGEPPRAPNGMPANRAPPRLDLADVRLALDLARRTALRMEQERVPRHERVGWRDRQPRDQPCCDARPLGRGGVGRLRQPARVP